VTLPAVLALLLAAAPAAAAGFGNSSMGEKAYGVLLLTPDAGGGWKPELTRIRTELRGAPLDSVETYNDGTAIQRALDRLKGQHVSKVVAIPLDLVSESAGMDHLRYLFGIREQPVSDRPDDTRPATAPVKSLRKSSIVLPGRGPKRLKALPRCQAVACGTRHSAALSVDGGVHAWGFWGADTHHAPTRLPPPAGSPGVLRTSSLGAGGWFTWYAPG